MCSSGNVSCVKIIRIKIFISVVTIYYLLKVTTVSPSLLEYFISVVFICPGFMTSLSLICSEIIFESASYSLTIF